MMALHSTLYHLSTVHIHIVRVPVALAAIRPNLTVDIVILALKITLVAGDGAVEEHPGRVLLALIGCSPCGTVLILVLTFWFDIGGNSWLRSGNLGN